MLNIRYIFLVDVIVDVIVDVMEDIIVDIIVDANNYIETLLNYISITYRVERT
jgi:hypothetical protein